MKKEIEQENWEKELIIWWEDIPEYIDRKSISLKWRLVEKVRQLLAKEEANWMAEIHEQIAEAEKRGYEKGYDCGNREDMECIEEQARKEIIEEIEKWAKKNYFEEENGNVVGLGQLLSKLKEL